MHKNLLNEIQIRRGLFLVVVVIRWLLKKLKYWQYSIEYIFCQETVCNFILYLYLVIKHYLYLIGSKLNKLSNHVRIKVNHLLVNPEGEL